MRNLLLVIGAFFFNSLQAGAVPNQSASHYQASVVQIMSKFESSRNQVAWNFSLLPVAEAGDGSSCLIAGWEGQIPAGTHSCTRADAMSKVLVNEHCKGVGTVYCNPEVFGDGVCIAPTAGDYRWTQSCQNRFLELVGVDANATSTLSASDLAKVDSYLSAQHFEAHEAADPLATLCSKIQKNHDRFTDDCNSVHAQLMSLSYQVINSKPMLENLKLRMVDATLSFKGEDVNQCKTVDLSAKTGRVKSQGLIGDCYAYTAVELMNYGAPDDEQISAISTAVQYGELFEKQNHGKALNLTTPFQKEALNQEVDGFSGGKITGAILAARTEGACKESDVPSYDRSDSRYFQKLQADFDNASRGVVL